MRTQERLAAWPEAGLIDEPTARRIAAYEATGRRRTESRERITLGKLVA